MSTYGKAVFVAAILLSLAVLAGCGGGGSPCCSDSYGWAAPVGEPALVSGYNITYLGHNYDFGDDETSFCYLVEGNGEPPGLSHWVVGLPECIVWEDVVAWDPDGDVVFVDPDPTTGVRGIKWDSGLPIDGSQMYCFTLQGNYAEGTIVVGVKAGPLAETAELGGPTCEPD